MNKHRTIKLTVPHPCHKDWDKMTLTETGRHCSSCNKTVIDFTSYTDKELLEFLKKGKRSGCGTFNDHQLNRPITITEPANRTFLHKLLYGTAFAAWLTGSANAQNNGSSLIATQYIQPINNTKQSSFGIGTGTISAINDSTHYIEGIVRSTSGHPLRMVNVSYTDNDTQAQTDSNGHFKLFIPDELVGKKISLYFNYRLKLKINATAFPITLKNPVEIKVKRIMGKF